MRFGFVFKSLRLLKHRVESVTNDKGVRGVDKIVSLLREFLDQNITSSNSGMRYSHLCFRIYAYSFSLRPGMELFDILVTLAKEGADIRMIVDYSAVKPWNKAFYEELIKCGVKILVCLSKSQTQAMHAKGWMLVSKDKDLGEKGWSGISYLGSANLSGQGLGTSKNSNYEYGEVLLISEFDPNTDGVVSGAFKNRCSSFDEMWNCSGHDDSGYFCLLEFEKCNFSFNSLKTSRRTRRTCKIDVDPAT